MKKVITYEFDEEDSQTEIRSAENGSLLALCLWEVKERVRKEWEECDEGGAMDKLITDVHEIVTSRIGDIDLYTE
jgi:hypothetical protein